MADSNRPDDDSIGGVVERSHSGAPAVGEAVRDRFSSDEVFQRIIAAADEEVTSGRRELFFSGVAAGLAITITFMLYVSMTASTDYHPILSVILYPLGFIYIIIGGYQLYTENTLPPVALTLERLASIPTLLRHWSIVLLGNVVGGGIGALVLSYGGVFTGDSVAAARYISEGGFSVGAVPLFFKAAMAGLIVAGVVWVGFASTDSVTRLLVVYLAFLAIPLGDLYHVVVSVTEVFYLFFEYNIPLYGAEISLYSGMVGFVLPVLLGNTVGGVVLVTLVNYFQTSEERLSDARVEGMSRQLSIPEWVLGRAAGRSYVPILNTTEASLFATEGHRIMVPITNLRTDGPIVELASRLASDREDGHVHIVHIVQAPDRMSLSAGAGPITDASEEGMAELRETAEGYDIEVSTSTVVSHRSFEEVFNMARRTRPDSVLMGWGEDQLWGAARAERPIDELTNQLPCDFLILNDRDLDTSRILLPTAGGPDSTLGAEVASVLSRTTDAEVSLLHVVDGPEGRADGEEFLTTWAEEHDLSDARRVVDESGDVEGAIAREAEKNSLIIIGATEKGVLARLVSNAVHLNVVNEVDCSVLLAERPGNRTLRERIFGFGRRAAGTPDEEDITDGTNGSELPQTDESNTDALASDEGDDVDTDAADDELPTEQAVVTDHDELDDDENGNEQAVVTDHDETDDENGGEQGDDDDENGDDPDDDEGDELDRDGTDFAR